MYILPQALTPTDSRPQATKFGCLSKLRRAPPHLVWFAQLSPKIFQQIFNTYLLDAAAELSSRGTV